MTSPRDYQKVFPFVDLASRLRWEYSLLDAGWQQMGNGGDATDLAAYARARGVGLIAWYNSGGEHNQAEDGPRDLLVDPETRRAEFKRIAALGFRGIKVDFMQSDKQYVIALYHDILRDAYANRLFVDFHGSTIPRGWQRTYPNLLTMEAVKGAEQYGDSVFQQNAAVYNTIYPFTRNVIGSMDYTPMIFGDAPDRLPHLTTNPHELALSVVFESGLQHFVSTPAMIDAQPEYVRDFLTAVPTVWDETRLVDGYPGRLAVLARRRGTDWYVGAITSDTMVSAVEVPLRFLGAGTYDVSLISDGEDVDRFSHETETLSRRDTMTVELAPRGGFVARFTRRGAAEAPPGGGAARPAGGTARPAPTRPTAPRPTVRPRRAP
jgi:alpha-glucosidase